MIIKFVMVANFFMHLKFDNRIYSRMLYGGLGLAVTLYALTLVDHAVRQRAEPSEELP